MPCSSRHSKRAFLSLALVVSSTLITQSGYALPIASGSSPAAASLSRGHTASIISTLAPVGSSFQIVKRAGQNDRLDDSASKKQTTQAANSGAGSSKSKKKKKKKKKVVWGPPPTRHGFYHRPAFDSRSLPDFSLQPIQTPWRQGMSYSLEWSAGPDMMKQIATAQRDGVVVEDHQESSTMTTARHSLSMDILLLPLDPGKTSELLLSRIPLSSHNARISVRTDIPADWYRLEIHFWDEDPHRLDHARYEPHSVTATVPDKADIWDVSSSSLILAPGLARTAQLSGIVHAREVGVWRSEEAIQVTALGPDVQEWKEFVETVSEETQQERWNSEFAARPEDMAASQQRYPELKKTFLEQQHSRNEFRMPRPITVGASGLQDRIKSLLYGLWRPGSSATSTTAAAAAAQPPIQIVTFERSHFPQESFRFKDAMDVAVNRELPPDFLEEELEEMREEVEEAGAQHLRFSEQQLEWDQALKQLDGLMAVWSAVPEYIVDDDAIDQDENYGAPPPGLSDLHILIEHGNDVIDPGKPMTWRANRDRTVSWQATKALASDNVLFTVELIKAVDIMEPGTESPESETKAELMTRAQLIQKSLGQPQLAILTDRIPGRWEATMVRVPSWVPSGTYQVRLKGVGDMGVQWADVSQPFAVQSDPYLYS